MQSSPRAKETADDRVDEAGQLLQESDDALYQVSANSYQNAVLRQPLIR